MANPGLARPLALLSSLKLTVALLGASIFLVFAGTLAQVDRGIWTVVSQYFRCWIAWVELGIFFPRSWNVPGGFPFPGGWLLGAVLVANLVASHASRIHVRAAGSRAVLGSAVLAVGVAATGWVILRAAGADSTGEVEAPFWRVSVQLLKGGGAAALLFWGCRLLFDRKAGIVLLHGGLVLLMSSELLTALTAVEGRMTIAEGQTVGFVEDLREVELAVVDDSDPSFDEVVVVSQAALVRGGADSPELPFEVRREGPFLKNAGLRPVRPGENPPATAGEGLRWVAEPRPEGSGVSAGGQVDTPAAYVTFVDRVAKKALGTYLVSVLLSGASQRVTCGSKTYTVDLRFKRTYKPYRIYLYDFRFERYVGTDIPRDYSSFVRLTDPERGVERDVRIWMNNPLRYRGDTLYQASFDPETEAVTVLQVVTNDGWMIPYVACMIVAAGLLGQFGARLIGFLHGRRPA